MTIVKPASPLAQPYNFMNIYTIKENIKKSPAVFSKRLVSVVNVTLFIL